MSIPVRMFHLAHRRMPSLFGKVVLHVLMRATARGFSGRPERLDGSHAERLHAYAAYTLRMVRERSWGMEEDGALPASNELDAVRNTELALRLREEMRSTACALRRVLRPTDQREAWEVVRVLYRVIGIVLEAQPIQAASASAQGAGRNGQIAQDGGVCSCSSSDTACEGNCGPSASVRMRSCYFSSIYGPATCALMSRMDEGLMAGLVGDGELVFSSRITQGADACYACFEMKGAAR
ncbi:MAG: hypothetical protein K6F70_03420 [Eggerthellaceae bacterium]|nr:hypothetical protein [Eggerthellaceae bacterium]